MSAEPLSERSPAAQAPMDVALARREPAGLASPTPRPAGLAAARAAARLARERKPLKRSVSPLKYAFPLVATLGILFGIYVVFRGAKPAPVAQPIVAPAHPPFKKYIAGSGIVEASTENVEISTPVPGVVTDVYVKVGQRVNKGEPLLRIESRDLEAELRVRQAALELAKAKLPEALANVDQAKRMYEIYSAVGDERAVSQEEFTKRKFAVATAGSRAAQAQSEIAAEEARVAQTKAEIERRQVSAPADGQVLQSKILVGEYAQIGPLATPLMVMGDTGRVHVRTSIDENDAWRFSPGAKAHAFVRGNPALGAEVTFVRVEPYVVPKMSLTGDTVERVDTRVLQVLYSFAGDALPVYVGQQMDVFIDVPPTAAELAASGATSQPATAPTKQSDPATQVSIDAAARRSGEER